MTTANENPKPRDLFYNSLERCTQSSSFIPSFYERFISSSPEIREKFKNTSFDRQNLMLLKSLQLSADATAGNPLAVHEITERAESHNRHHHDIKPELYELWLENLILTAREYDKEWDDMIEDAWRTILGIVIRRMCRSY